MHSWGELTTTDDDGSVDGKGAINQFNIESASIEHAGMMCSAWVSERKILIEEKRKKILFKRVWLRLDRTYESNVYILKRNFFD